MVQDMCLSKESMFVCGTYSMAGNVLRSFVDWISESQWNFYIRKRMISTEVGGNPLGTELLFQLYDMSFTIDAEAEEGTSGRNLSRLFFGIEDEESLIAGVFGVLIFRNQHRWATDPRDKIYGILGLAKSFQKSMPSILPLPDYSKPTHKVYQESVEFILRHSRSLGILSLVAHSDHYHLTGLPSWVADFSRARESDCLLRYETHNAPRGWELTTRKYQ
jgi:hypothetical protein